jgi:hypothetical protein
MNLRKFDFSLRVYIMLKGEMPKVESGKKLEIIFSKEANPDSEAQVCEACHGAKTRSFPNLPDPEPIVLPCACCGGSGKITARERRKRNFFGGLPV